MVELFALKTLTEKLDTRFAETFVMPERIGSHDDVLKKLNEYQLIIDNIDSYIAIVTIDLKMALVNKKLKEMLKDRLGICPSPGDPVYKTLYNLDTIPEWDPFVSAIKRRKIIIREFTSPATKRRYGLIAIPLIYDGVSGVMAIATDEDEI